TVHPATTYSSVDIVQVVIRWCRSRDAPGSSRARVGRAGGPVSRGRVSIPSVGSRVAHFRPIASGARRNERSRIVRTTARDVPAPAPAAPDPTAPPVGPDSTGASYTGASTTAALTKDKDGKVTDATIAADVKNLKMGLNIFWTLVTGFLVMFMQSGFALLETG